MTLDELIENLEDMRDRAGSGDIKVRLAMQPNYPMLGSPRNVCLEHTSQDDDSDNPRVLIACSDHEDYGCPRDAWDTDEIYPDDED